MNKDTVVLSSEDFCKCGSTLTNGYSCGNCGLPLLEKMTGEEIVEVINNIISENKRKRLLIRMTIDIVYKIKKLKEYKLTVMERTYKNKPVMIIQGDNCIEIIQEKSRT